MQPPDAHSPDANPGRLVAGRYRLLSPLGEGGMGTVWRARDEALRREVAVKEVRAPAGLPAAKAERMYARLEREAWAAARITARGVITVHDVVTDEGRPWIVMELVRGRSLSDLLAAGGALPPREAARIGAEVLAALRAAHDAGVLHRDVKPANVLLADDGRVVLSDFGIALVQGDTALTLTGEVVGSPEYIAPEQALGRTPDSAADLWSLGVLLYTVVQGRSPFRQDTALNTLRAVVDTDPPHPHRAGPLTPLIAGLLRKDPAERISAERTEEALRRVAAHDGDPGADTEATATSGTAVVRAGASPDGEVTATAGTVAPVPAPPATAAASRTAPGDSPAAVTAETGRTVGAPAVPSRPSPDDVITFADALTTGLVEPAEPPAPQPAPVPVPSPRRSRRTAYVLTAMGVVFVLLLGGLGYALTRENTAASAGPSVTVSVTGAGTAYAGACPPPQVRAPAFTATFQVTGLPVQFSYRWVSAHGAVVDPAWRTLSFPKGGPRTDRESVRLTTYAQTGTLTSAMAVEIRSPFQQVSTAVPFSLTCTP
ncbi:MULTISPECIES: serine/threonine-protein kinase [Streptomyces]|uniref:serine/threonine-protein kinase n=1 Tax=Streptomyces TaxID=1883 RepID=UPI0023DD1668|nr:serine/threonine-protein kinase [Streptomyces sp. FXJ1.172]WEP00931.1 serine/threonine-protein kinase [Streptomyces sp. FXJ1.172]